MTQDLNYTRDATFSVDLPNGEYDVSVTLGEALIPHDQMGVFLEGVQVDNVTTAAYEHVTSTHRIGISDGQLTLRLFDLGGSNIWAVINALDILFVGPDLTGPSVASTDISGNVEGPIDKVTLTFSEPIDASSFTEADIAVLEGPNGPITPLGVNQVAPGQFEVSFDPQNDAGNYRLVIGPQITDVAGNVMDQDGDGIGGESLDDQFESTFTLVPGPELVAQIDFGSTTSPVAVDYTRVTSSDRYNASVGYGWQVGSVYSLNRGGDALTRDLNYTADATFAFDLPNGEYEITVTQGEALIAHDLMAVYLEDVQVDTISTPAYQFAINTYVTQVVDGQLNLRLRDLGGSNGWAVINGLVIARPVVATAGVTAAALMPSSDGADGSVEPLADSAGALPPGLAKTSNPKVVGKTSGPIGQSNVASLHDAVMSESWSGDSADSETSNQAPGLKLFSDQPVR